LEIWRRYDMGASGGGPLLQRLDGSEEEQFFVTTSELAMLAEAFASGDEE
jgi:hypothetical protein